MTYIVGSSKPTLLFFHSLFASVEPNTSLNTTGSVSEIRLDFTCCIFGPLFWHRKVMWMTSVLHGFKEKMKHKGWLNAHTCSRHMFLNVRHVISFHLSIKASESLANNTHVSHTQQRAWHHSLAVFRRRADELTSARSHDEGFPSRLRSEGQRPSTPSSVHTRDTSFHTQHEEIYSRALLPVWGKNCYCAFNRAAFTVTH